MRAGIVIDTWKLRTFELILRRAGYSYTQGPGIVRGTVLLTVETDDVDALSLTVAEANREAQLDSLLIKFPGGTC